MVRLAASSDNNPSVEQYENQMGKFRAKGLICFEEISDYSILDDKKLAKKLKRKIEEPIDLKKNKKQKKLPDQKSKSKDKKKATTLSKKAKKEPKSKDTNKTPDIIKEENKTDEVKVKPELDEAAKKLKREQKLKKIAKRRKKKEKRKAEIKAKKVQKTSKSNSTSRTSMHSIDAENTQEFDQADFNEKMKGWSEMMLPHVLLRALYDKSFFNPMPIQKMVLPEAINKKANIIGTAQTGSGKTLAFGLPILTHLIDSHNAKAYSINEEQLGETDKFPQALILTPTRELAVQIKEHLQVACKYQKTKIVVVVGGISQMKQERLLKQEPEIIVATPGRLMQMIDEGNQYLNKITQIKYLVIDEADRMIEKGHFGEMEKILGLINSHELIKKKRQNFLFSATLITKFQDDINNEETKKPRTQAQLEKELKLALNELIDKVQMSKEPKVFDLTTEAVTAENLFESKLFCTKTEKDIYLYYFCCKYVGRTLVFANSIDCVRRLNNLFKLLKRTPLILHAHMEQKQRLKNLEKFNADENSLLIASDVASRGLDIPNVMNVIHYQTPRSAEVYVHRSGRTARSTKEGLSVMLVSPDEMNSYKKILQSIKKSKDIRDYPIDIDFMDSCKKIVTLGRKIDESEHTLNKAKNETNWYAKNAKELDVEIDDELIKETQVDSVKLEKQKRELQKNKNELAGLLKKPIFPKNFSKNYIATENLKRFNSINNTSENALDGMRTTDLANKQKKKNFKEIKNINTNKNKK